MNDTIHKILNLQSNTLISCRSTYLSIEDDIFAATQDTGSTHFISRGLEIKNLDDTFNIIRILAYRLNILRAIVVHVLLLHFARYPN